MKKSKFSDTQIVSILKQGDAGVPVKDLCRQAGISSLVLQPIVPATRGPKPANQANRDGESANCALRSPSADSAACVLAITSARRRSFELCSWIVATAIRRSH